MSETRKGWNGAVALVATMAELPDDERLPALGLFLDAALKSMWFTREPCRVESGEER